MDQKPKRWVDGAVAYQIYPRSFYDSNGDGVGDLRGIIEKLDYLGGTRSSLGVSAIWLCPFYPSPMVDFGYDITEYCDVDPLFGTLSDFKELLYKAHAHNIRVIIDLVANHTSDEHPWFKESRSSLDNPKRDWYTWHPPGTNGGPPNNWRSVFGGTAWQFEEQTGQYYLHSFSVRQPDLNWNNPEVRQAIKEVMKFWLDLGVDGFRADAVYWISKDDQFRNDPLKLNYTGNANDYDALEPVYNQEGPHLYTYLKELEDVLKSYKDRFMVVETSATKEVDKYLRFYEFVDSDYIAPFNFQSILFPWRATDFRSFIDQFQSGLEPLDLPVYVLGNHDKHRLASRIGRSAAATAAMMQLTLPGMPFIYYGEEIGMIDVLVRPELQKDPLRIEEFDRDMVRTPLQWDASANGGFTKGQPWLPLAQDYQTVNIEQQFKQKKSLLNLYRKLIELRRDSEVLKYGIYKSIDTSESVYGFERQLDHQKIVVLLNFRPDETEVDLEPENQSVVVKLSTYMDVFDQNGGNVVKLRPNEGLVIELK